MSITRTMMAAGVTILVALAARPVSAEPDCSVHGACCFPSGSRTKAIASTRYRATIGRPQGASSAVVKRVVARYANELAACYPHRFPPTSKETGLQLAILPTGRAELVGAVGFDTEVTSCMAKVIAGAAFPEVTDTILAFVPIRIER